MNNPEKLTPLRTYDTERRQAKQKTQKTKKMSNTDQKLGVNPGARER